MRSPALRTVVQAIEDAAASSKTGYRFIDESSDAEPFFTHSGIERATARFGGALQALGAKKGDRVALILPDNADFIFAFLGAIRAGKVINDGDWMLHSTMLAIMGRMAAYSGKKITWKDAIGSKEDLAPEETLKWGDKFEPSPLPRPGQIA